MLASKYPQGNKSKYIPGAAAGGASAIFSMAEPVIPVTESAKSCFAYGWDGYLANVRVLRSGGGSGASRVSLLFVARLVGF